MKLVLVGRRTDKLKQIANTLKTHTHILPLDLLSNRQGVTKAFSDLPNNFSEIDILVNNTGLALGLESATEANLNDWDQVIDTNIKGLISI